ncbi:MAG: hypothetical protein WC543_00910 [Candidatus Omnitrophota bacterium]
MKITRKAQSTLEYVIILAAVVGAIIVIAVFVKKNIGDDAGMYGTLGESMEKSVKDDFKF